MDSDLAVIDQGSLRLRQIDVPPGRLRSPSVLDYK